MSNYVFIHPGMGHAAPMSQTATAQAWELGMEVQARDLGPVPLTGSAASSSVGANTNGAAIFRYVQGGATSASQGQLVMLQGHSAFPCGTAHKGSNFPIGVACGPLSATNVFGWVQVEGVCDYGKISNHDIAVGASAFLASTPGLVATTQGATGAFIHGIHFPVSITSTQSAVVTFYLNRPRVGPSSAL